MTGRARQLAVRLVAAVLVTAAAGAVGVAAAPAAEASTCASGSGVSVVVDFGSLGGGAQSSCAAGGAGQSASSLFTGAGFALSYVQNEPGFVCRVNQAPSPSDQACVTTPPSDAYWGLWWSDGTSGTWNYSNYGVGSLKVPDGGSVAFAWQSGDRTAPGVQAPVNAVTTAPTAPTATPSASATSGSQGPTKPTKPAKPTKKPTPQPTTADPQPTQSSAGSASAVPSPSAAASASATPTASDSPVASPSAAAPSTEPVSAAATGVTTAPPSESATPLASEDPVGAETTAAVPDAVPAWVVPVVILVLAAGAGVTFLLRRRRLAGP